MNPGNMIVFEKELNAKLYDREQETIVSSIVNLMDKPNGQQSGQWNLLKSH